VIEDSRLVGIVSRRDILALFARSDVDLAADVRRTIGISVGAARGPICVSVVDGVVTLGGAMGHRGETETAARLAADIPGVVGVINRLAWRDTSRAS
jgi:osmotically-inducible protein OsmY